MNKTQLYIQLPETSVVQQRFGDTYLALGPFGPTNLQLGLEFPVDVTGIFNVGDNIFIDKDDKSINPWADGPATILGFTFSTVYPAPATLVFTSIPLQLPISFTSGEAGALYLGSSIQSGWTEVDLSDNVAFPITFNIADVREINNRNGAYSKTIQIPGTKTNNDVFKYIFDIQGVDNYDTRVKVKCNVVVDTIPVLEGYIQLNSISCNDNRYWTYDCVIFGENANFSKEIDQNARLEDLDFSEFNHDFNISSVTQSWIGDYTDGYYYPYIDYNVGANPRFGRFNKIENFKASIYAKQYWDRIFKEYGYTYESNFLNTEAFTNLIIPPTKTVLENNRTFRILSTFRAGLTSSAFYNLSFGFQRASNPTLTGPVFSNFINFLNTLQPPADLSNVLQLNDTISPNGDPGSNFIQVPLGEFYYKNVYENNYDKTQDMVLNLDFKITATFSNGTALTLGQLEGSRFVLFCDIFVNNQRRKTVNILQYGKLNNVETQSNTPIVDQGVSNLVNSIFGEPEEDWSIDSFVRKLRTVSIRFGPNETLFLPNGTIIENDLQPNDEVRFKLGIYHFRSINSDNTSSTIEQQTRYLNTGFNLEFYPTTDGIDGTYFYNTIDTRLIENQPYDISEVIPSNIKQIDFINSIVKMFNLYLYQDKDNPKNIFIEPRDQFYETTSFLNWSDKLDISKETEQTPIVERYKRILMSYKADKDYYNTDYNRQTKEIYGQLEYLTGDEFSTAEKKFDVIFSPTPLNNFQMNDGTLDNTHIYSRILDPKQPITTETSGKVESNIRILYRKTLSNTTENFSIRTNDNIFRFDTFPYAGHLDDPTNATLDLSFDQPKFLFYESDFEYTGNSLYTEYYAQFFEELYGVESKLIIAYVYLNSQDLLDFDYRKLIYIDNISSGSPGYFRVNKIEYDPFNKQSYKVELIKVLNNFKQNKRRFVRPDVGIVLPGTGNSVVTPGNNTNTGGGVVIGGFDNFSEGLANGIIGQYSVVSGCNNIINGSCNSIIGSNNSILGGRTNRVSSNDSSIVSGASNSVSGNRSVIVGGFDNEANTYSSNSLIMSGYGNRIGTTGSSTQSSVVLNSFILGGKDNTIFAGTTTSNTDNVFLLGGQNNIIAPGVTNSFVVGGENFTATQSNTIYLEASTISIDGNVFINGSAPSVVTPIPAREIAFGTGAGIVSSSALKFDTSFNLIAGSPTNTLSSTSYSSMIGGSGNTITYQIASSIIGGINNTVDAGIRSSIIGGLNNTIDTNSDTAILGGQNNLIYGNSARYSSIIAGQCNELRDTANNSAIVAGYRNLICGTSFRSSIIGGSTNTIDDSRRSLILGGQNLTLTAEDDTVLVPNLIVDNNISFNNVAGTATITAATSVVVNNTRVQAGSKILITGSGNSTFFVTAIVAGTSFTINAGTSGTYTISWLIIN